MKERLLLFCVHVYTHSLTHTHAHAVLCRLRIKILFGAQDTAPRWYLQDFWLLVAVCVRGWVRTVDACECVDVCGCACVWVHANCERARRCIGGWECAGTSTDIDALARIHWLTTRRASAQVFCATMVSAGVLLMWTLVESASVVSSLTLEHWYVESHAFLPHTRVMPLIYRFAKGFALALCVAWNSSGVHFSFTHP